MNPKPAGHNNLKVCFSGANDGFILNFNGDLVRTKEGGNTWAIQQNFSLARAVDIKDSTGIIAGFSNFVYISTDNGISWEKKLVSNYKEPYFAFVQKGVVLLHVQNHNRKESCHLFYFFALEYSFDGEV